MIHLLKFINAESLTLFAISLFIIGIVISLLNFLMIFSIILYIIGLILFGIAITVDVLKQNN